MILPVSFARALRRAVGAGLALAFFSATPGSAAKIDAVAMAKPEHAGFLLSGEIVDGDLLKLQTEIAKLPPERSITVYLESPGGSLGEGVRMGEFFYQARIATAIKGRQGRCLSACAIAFLGGRDAVSGRPMRIKPTTSLLGFHAFRLQFDERKKFTAENMSEMVAVTQRISYALIEYFRTIKVEASFLPLMLKAPTEQMRLVGNDEALKLGFQVWDETAKNLIDPGSIRSRIESAMNMDGSRR
jgi:hypothetical protein